MSCYTGPCRLPAPAQKHASRTQLIATLNTPTNPLCDVAQTHQDPSLWPAAVDEICRYHTASAYALRRVAIEDVKMRDTVIRCVCWKGGKVCWCVHVDMAVAWLQDTARQSWSGWLQPPAEFKVSPSCMPCLL